MTVIPQTQIPLMGFVGEVIERLGDIVTEHCTGCVVNASGLGKLFKQNAAHSLVL